MHIIYLLYYYQWIIAIFYLKSHSVHRRSDVPIGYLPKGSKATCSVLLPHILHILNSCSHPNLIFDYDIVFIFFINLWLILLLNKDTLELLMIATYLKANRNLSSSRKVNCRNGSSSNFSIEHYLPLFFIIIFLYS